MGAQINQTHRVFWTLLFLLAPLFLYQNCDDTHVSKGHDTHLSDGGNGVGYPGIASISIDAFPFQIEESVLCPASIEFYKGGSKQGSAQLENKNLNLYNERVMAFDEWDAHYPILNQESLQYPEKELDPDFYKNKMISRDQPRTLSSFYID